MKAMPVALPVENVEEISCTVQSNALTVPIEVFLPLTYMPIALEDEDATS